MNVRHNSMCETDLRREKTSFASNLSSLETQRSCWNKRVNVRKPHWFGECLTGTRSQENMERQCDLMVSAQRKLSYFSVLSVQISKFSKWHLKGWDWFMLVVSGTGRCSVQRTHLSNITGDGAEGSYDICELQAQVCHLLAQDLGQLTPRLWTIFVSFL